MSNRRRPIEILLLEANASDRLATVSALAQAHVLNNLHAVDDVVEALAFLRQEGKYSAARRPDVVLVDIGLPRRGGDEVLRAIQSDARLRTIPVVVLSATAEEAEQLSARGLSVHSFIRKPVTFQELAKVLSGFQNFWFEVVSLPPPSVEPLPPTPLLPAPELPEVSGTHRAPAALETHGVSGVQGAVGASGTHTQGGLAQESTRVLLIEDSPSDSLLLLTALNSSERLRFEVTTADRLDRAESLLSKRSFDVIVSDLGLPDCEGLDAVRRLRRAEPFVPIIVLTGRDDDEIGVLAMRAGAQDFVTKGATPWRVVVRTVTHAVERARLEAQLRHAQRAEAVGQLAAGIAHDFNNILAVIQGHVGLMAEEETSPDLRSSIDEIGSAVGRASNLTRQLLTFTRQQPFKRKWLDCNVVVGDLYKMLSRVIGEGIHIELQLASALPGVFVDVGMIEQVIVNLTINARDAMPGRGKLTLRTTARTVPEVPRLNSRAKPGSYVCLSVLDTGSGIPPEILPRIFEPYFTTKESGRGTGLGLATVQGIVSQHDGWIEVQSTVGSGTRFDVYLPAGEKPVQSSPPPHVATPTPGQGETILVVEDEPALRAVFSNVLRRHGYRVLVAEHASQVLENWESWASDVSLVITDIVMPSGMNGLELIEHLRRLRPTLPFLCVSGYAPEYHSASFSLMEGENFFQKPYDVAAVAVAIRRLLSGG
jgi:CheY-like chemotaxis protein